MRLAVSDLLSPTMLAYHSSVPPAQPSTAVHYMLYTDKTDKYAHEKERKKTGATPRGV